MLNEVVLMGRLTATPSLNQTNSGALVTSFAIAVDRRFYKEEKKADFINCVAWKNTAEFICRYFKKGEMIAVTGEIQTRSWDKPDGTKGFATEVVIDKVSFCGGKNEAPVEMQGNPDYGNDDDLPF